MVAAKRLCRLGPNSLSLARNLSADRNRVEGPISRRIIAKSLLRPALPSFGFQKCCTMHERQVRRAATQLPNGFYGRPNLLAVACKPKVGGQKPAVFADGRFRGAVSFEPRRVAAGSLEPKTANAARCTNVRSRRRTKKGARTQAAAHSERNDRFETQPFDYRRMCRADDLINV